MMCAEHTLDWLQSRIFLSILGMHVVFITLYSQQVQITNDKKNRQGQNEKLNG